MLLLGQWISSVGPEAEVLSSELSEVLASELSRVLASELLRVLSSELLRVLSSEPEMEVLLSSEPPEVEVGPEVEGVRDVEAGQR